MGSSDWPESLQVSLLDRLDSSWFHRRTLASSSKCVSHVWNQLLWCLWWKQRSCRLMVGPTRGPSLMQDAVFLFFLCRPLCQRCTDFCRCGQQTKKFLTLIIWSVSVRWSQVRSQPPSRPCRRLSTRLADALFLSLGNERQPWLRANGFVCFIEKL